jgi:RimJ/RimL family protein N-acetyltransferase
VVTLQTGRLLLRPFRPDDIDAYAAMCADSEVMRYVGGPLSREDAWRHMAMLVWHWTLRGYGMWALEKQESGAFIGRVGLHYPDGWPGRELGWALVRRFWGHGLAEEGCRAVLRHAYETLGWSHLISLIHPDNDRSTSTRFRAHLYERT